MNNEWQHRIYNQEVTPPASTWEKISAELDESQLSDSFPGTLYNAEAEPPAGTWNVIATALAEEELSHEFPSTLYNAEATPPPAAWEQIVAALDEEKKETYQFASTLYNMEATPPPAAWQKIESALDDQPRRRRVIPLFIRYAAAAVLVGAVAFGAVQLVNSFNKKDGAGVAQGTGTKPTDDGNEPHKSTASGVEGSTPDKTATVDEDQQTQDDLALENSKGTMASLSLSDKARMAHEISQYVAADAPAATISSTEKIKPQSTYRDIECAEVSDLGFASYSSTIDMATRYILFKTPDGRMVRISKKLGDLVCCVSGDEVDENCENQLDKWRKKIANSPVAPSPGNFMDILNLVSSLKDNNL